MPADNPAAAAAAAPVVSIIVAVAADGAIGRDGDMPFHIPTDLSHFREVTMGKPVIMGRRTFDSLPKGPLPGRRNIVVSRNPDYSPGYEGVDTARSLDEAIAMAVPAPEVMIIGGAMLYAAALPIADRMWLTLIDAEAPGADTFFPAYDPAEWRVISGPDPAADPKSGLTMRFVTLERV